MLVFLSNLSIDAGVIEEKTHVSSNYIAGYNGQQRTSNFYRTLENQKFRDSLKNVPIYVVLNGDSELVLAKPTNSFDVTKTLSTK